MATSTVLHRLTAYKKAALWDDVQRWFDGGAPRMAAIKPEASAVHNFRQRRRIELEHLPARARSVATKSPLAWKAFATSFTPNPITFGYKWNDQLTARSGIARHAARILPARHERQKAAVDRHRVQRRAAGAGPHASTALRPPKEKPQEPRTTPEEPTSCWKKPGPGRRPVQGAPRRWQRGDVLLVSLRRPARDAQRRPHAGGARAGARSASRNCTAPGPRIATTSRRPMPASSPSSIPR